MKRHNEFTLDIRTQKKLRAPTTARGTHIHFGDDGTIISKSAPATAPEPAHDDDASDDESEDKLRTVSSDSEDEDDSGEISSEDDSDDCEEDEDEVGGTTKDILEHANDSRRLRHNFHKSQRSTIPTKSTKAGSIAITIKRLKSASSGRSPTTLSKKMSPRFSIPTLRQSMRMAL